MIIVDGHEDIAQNVLINGRDFTQSVAATRAREGEPRPGVGTCSLALPDLLAGGVGLVFGTLFTLPAAAVDTDLPTEQGYRDADEAHTHALAQLAVYRDLAEHNALRLIHTRGDLRALSESWTDPTTKRVLGLVVLMENADPIRVPEEAGWWFEQGVRIVGPAWQATRYCGGTRQPGPLTTAGRALMGELERAGFVLDISHMAEESFWQALDLFNGPVIASHSNCRALLPDIIADRHLSDAMIRALIERDAVIGAVLFSHFLAPTFDRQRTKASVRLDSVLRHIDHICQLAGNTRHVAIGSDIDGGFGSEHLPLEMDSAADLPHLGEALLAAGYSQADTEAIMGKNWLRMLENTLPTDCKV